MRRLLSALPVLLILAAILAVSGILLIPDQVESTWKRLGLPEAPLIQVTTFLGRGPTAADVRLYGVLEARETYAMSELPGLISAVLVKEGEVVPAGGKLAELDPTDVKAGVEASRETVLTAKLARDAVAAPPAATDVAVAEAAVSAAETRLENARRTMEQAQRTLKQPLDIEAEVNRVRTLLPAAEAGVSQAQAEVARVNVLLESAQKDGSRDGKFMQSMLRAQLAAAQANVEAAQAQQAGLQRSLTLLTRMRNNPIGLRAQATASQQEVKLAEAALAVAQADRDAVAAHPLPEAVEVAETQIHAAETSLDLAKWQAERQSITAPEGGKVLARLVEPGETAQPGAPLFTIADTTDLELRAYVALQDLPLVHLGQILPVEVVSLPDHHIQGVVTFIASEAQFRPNNVLNLEDRGDMVFLIKLRLDNPDDLLKPGMPADVLLPSAGA